MDEYVLRLEYFSTHLKSGGTFTLAAFGGAHGGHAMLCCLLQLQKQEVVQNKDCRAVNQVEITSLRTARGSCYPTC